jgi:DNA-binding transcriptional regulator YdaS (Cro superfamily)
MNHADTLREQLRDAIAEHGQSAIARETGIPQPNISAWLAGRRPMSLDQCAAIARSCGLTLEVRVGPTNR